MRLDLDKPIPGFEHANLGPLPHDPRLLRLQSEALAWKKKYEDVFQEQCGSRTIDNTLREKLKITEIERDKFKSMIDAQREIIVWLLQSKV